MVCVQMILTILRQQWNSERKQLGVVVLVKFVYRVPLVNGYTSAINWNAVYLRFVSGWSSSSVWVAVRARCWCVTLEGRIVRSWNERMLHCTFSSLFGIQRSHNWSSWLVRTMLLTHKRCQPTAPWDSPAASALEKRPRKSKLRKHIDRRGHRPKTDLYFGLPRFKHVKVCKMDDEDTAFIYLN